MRYVVSGELTSDKIREILNYWFVNEKPKLDKKYNYYLGKQAIMNKGYTDESKPCNRIVTNFCHEITQQYLGFNVGVPVSYTVEDKVLDFLKYNDVIQKDNMLLRNALIFGKSYELQFLDNDARNRFETIDTRNGIDIYSDELQNDELKAFIRFYYTDNVGLVDQANWVCEVYDREKITTYKGLGDFSTLSYVSQIEHNFGQVPVVVFSLNPEEEGIFEQVMSLQDGYNTLLSSEIDDWEAFCDAYLVLKGISADEEDIKSMKQNRVLILDTDSAAEYLTKQVNDSQIQNMLGNIKDMILKISNCPDFTDPNFMSSSGIALEYKLVGFSNVSKAFMDRMDMALRKRIELFATIEAIKGDDVFADAKITFTQNIPKNTMEVVQVINMLRGIVTDETLLSLLPFIDNPKEEVKKLQKQKEANMELYNFGTSDEDEEVSEDEQVLG